MSEKSKVTIRIKINFANLSAKCYLCKREESKIDTRNVTMY